MKFVIITGLSGAGKSQAMRCMEDLGFYCVDNLPPILIPKFSELCFDNKGEIEKIALVIDIRGGKFFDDLFESLEILEVKGYKYEILFLEASDETLIKRFKETRRVHPLNPQGRITDGIKAERMKLNKFKEKAHKIIDTSNMTPGKLKEEIKEIYLEGSGFTNILVSIFPLKF